MDGVRAMNINATLEEFSKQFRSEDPGKENCFSPAKGYLSPVSVEEGSERGISVRC